MSGVASKRTHDDGHSVPNLQLSATQVACLSCGGSFLRTKHVRPVCGGSLFGIVSKHTPAETSGDSMVNHHPWRLSNFNFLVGSELVGEGLILLKYGSKQQQWTGRQKVCLRKYHALLKERWYINSDLCISKSREHSRGFQDQKWCCGFSVENCHVQPITPVIPSGQVLELFAITGWLLLQCPQISWSVILEHMWPSGPQADPTDATWGSNR